ncbi:hypothetical protein PI93_011620 [Pandoraea fibrosis]|uniref:Integrase n=1 Tax=Pandoraea fibrosis TaxID=1891094 RepID=A0ABX6HQN7_9BURK|nr:hypothetical protein [Pandoraea fibrosis]QHE93229.1 hypothetical protein PJ20_016380 [Pandoraea fibrosis]QHF13212.1 hypothetical protein PI93_011620 [Pandoraea fibrosis]
MDDYVDLHKRKHKEKAWPHYAEYIKSSFRDVDVDQADPAYVVEFLTSNWNGKLQMQRVVRAFLSGLFSWCLIKRHMSVNSCREVKLKKPKAWDVYIPDGHFITIRNALAKEKGGREIRSGEPYGATAVRSAWDRACERAGLGNVVYTIKGIRAKALTDAERAGYTMEQLRIAAAHSDIKTTEIYLKPRLTLTSVVRMNMPKAG